MENVQVSEVILVPCSCPVNFFIFIFYFPLLGFHAVTCEEFADAIQTVLTLSPYDESCMRWRARAWAVQRFSEEEFEKGWNQSGWRTWLYWTFTRFVELGLGLFFQLINWGLLSLSTHSENRPNYSNKPDRNSVMNWMIHSLSYICELF